MEINIKDKNGNIKAYNFKESVPSLMEDIEINPDNYVPQFLKESSRIMSFTELLKILLSDNDLTFKAIKQSYYDGMYKQRNYSKLSYEAKITLIEDLGFTYLTQILELTNEQLTKLLTFFDLIYTLKGKDEGLMLCLDTLGLDYLYIPWDIVAKIKGQVPTYEDLPILAEPGDTYQITATGSYYIYLNSKWRYTKKQVEYQTKRQPFTAELDILSVLSSEKVLNLKAFVRSYMLHWVNINTVITEGNTDFYVWCLPGVLNKVKYTKVYNVNADLGNS